MKSTNTQARAQLDARFKRMGTHYAQPRPHKGWIRAIRDALGMSSRELAERMGIAQQTVVDLERNEQRGTIKLETLQRAAEALDCELVYFLRPRASLEESVLSQARRRAAQHLRQVAHHSRLEDQTVPAGAAAAHLDEIAAEFVDRRGLWSEPPARR